MEIVLHIGTEKTGTTSIQNFIVLNNSLLRDNGFYTLYDHVLPKAANNLALVLAVNDCPGNDLLQFRHLPIVEYRNFIKESIRKIIDEATKSHANNLICSSEHMSSRLVNIENVKALKALFPESCSFKIVVYFRKQSELFIGRQAEGIKFGGQTNLSSPAIPAETRELYNYNYEKRLEIWESVFGPSAIIVRPYEKDQLNNGDVISDFLSVLKLEYLQGKAKKVNEYNKRLSPEILFYISKMNKYLPDNFKRRQIIKMLELVDEFEPGIFCKNEELKNFYNHFNESNKRVAEKYLGRDKIFIADIEKYREFDEADFYKEDNWAKITCALLDKMVNPERGSAVKE